MKARITGGVLAGLLALSALPALAAPSDEEVAAAEQNVTAAAARVAAVEVELQELVIAQQDAEIALMTAQEDQLNAQTELEEAEAYAALTAQQASDSETDLELARQDLVSMGRATYQGGNVNVGAAALFLPDQTFDQLVTRTTTASHLVSTATDGQQRYEAAELVAQSASTQAAAALVAKQDALAARDAAVIAAAEALTAAEQTATDTAARRDALVAELAAAEQISVELAQARADEIERQRIARQEQEARDRLQNTPTQPEAPAQSQQPQTPNDPQPTSPEPAEPQTPPAVGGGDTPVTPAPSPTPAPNPNPTTTPTPTPTPAPAPGGQHGLGTGTSKGTAATGNKAVEMALAKVGLPYIWGGVGPTGYDCSGLTMISWREAGVNIPRTTRDQYRHVLKIDYNDLRPGDLIFRSTDPNDPSKIYHVEMYIGNNQVVHAPSPGKELHVKALTWSNAMPYAGRA